MITVTNLISRLQTYINLISGARVENADWIEFLNSYLRWIRRKHNPPWTKRTSQLLVYNDVYEYPLPVDFQSLIRPELLTSESQDDDAWFLFQNQPDFHRNWNRRNDLALDWNRTTKYVLIRHPAEASLVLGLDSFDGEGTWSASGTASNISTDTVQKRRGSGSIRFDVASLGTAVLTVSTLPAQDLTDYKNRSRVFLDVDIPVAGVTSVAIRFGTDSSNYYETPAITTQFNGAAFTTGWNLVSDLWTNVTTTGSPTITNIKYIRVALAGAAVANGYHIDNLAWRLPKEFALNYYSTSNVLDTDGVTYKSSFVNLGDQLLGDEEWEDLATYFSLKQAAAYKVKNSDLEVRADVAFKEAYLSFITKYPSLQPLPAATWFNL